jgi:hypothetical protein
MERRSRNVPKTLLGLYISDTKSAQERLQQRSKLYLQLFLVLLNGLPDVIEVLHCACWIRVLPVARRLPPINVTTGWILAHGSFGTYLGEIMLGGDQDPFPRFPTDFFGVG